MSSLIEEVTSGDFSDYVMETALLYVSSILLASGIAYAVPLFFNWNLLYLCGIVLLIPLVRPAVKKCIPRKRISPGGKAVFISGCDTGFGHMLAQRLDDLGFQVFAGCLFPGSNGAEELRKSGSSRLHVIGLDVTSDSSVQEAATYVQDNLQDNVLWAVVNNAGIAHIGDLSWADLEKIIRVFEVNTIGVIRLSKKFLASLMKTKGRIVTTCSIAGQVTLPGAVPYSMSKAAAIRFSEGLRLEMRKWGVKSISIIPFLYKTPIFTAEVANNQISEGWEKAPTDMKDIYGSDYIGKYLADTIATANKYGISDTSEVISVIEESIMALFPENSYSVGGRLYMNLISIANYLLPEEIREFLYCYILNRGYV